MPSEIPDSDFIVRYCSPSTVIDNHITRAAFQIKPSNDFTSVNWMPKNMHIHEGLEQIKSILEQKNFHIRSNGRFAVFNAHTIKSYVYDLTGIKISICHVPSPGDPTHAGILPTNTSDSSTRQKIMFDIARALSRFTRKNPDTVYLIPSDEKIV